MSNTIYVSILFMLIGVVLLGCGIFLFFRQRAMIAQSLSAEGVVVELIRRKMHKKHVQLKTRQGATAEEKYMYRPVVSFRTQAGRAIKFSPSIAMGPAPYQVGERVPVLYQPDHPQQAQINRFIYLWFYVLMLIFFGFFALGMGAFGVVMQVI